MRLEPVRSRNPLLRAVTWLLARRFGRRVTPYDVVFARLPAAVPTQLAIYGALQTGLGLDRGLTLLVQQHVSTLNGCSFCTDIGRAMATYRGVSREQLDALPAWRTSDAFTPAERAALAYVEEATRDRRVADATFAELRAHFDDRAIVAITWLAAVESYFNLLNRPLEIGSDGLCAIADRRAAARGRAAA